MIVALLSAAAMLAALVSIVSAMMFEERSINRLAWTTILSAFVGLVLAFAAGHLA